MAVEQKGEQGRMMVNVNLEHIRGPSTDCLNNMKRDTSFSKGSGTSCIKRMATNIVRKVVAEKVKKPCLSEDSSIFFEPQLSTECYNFDTKEVSTVK
jgi:hypothetical protein